MFELQVITLIKDIILKRNKTCKCNKIKTIFKQFGGNLGPISCSHEGT